MRVKFPSPRSAAAFAVAALLLLPAAAAQANGPWPHTVCVVNNIQGLPLANVQFGIKASLRGIHKDTGADIEFDTYESRGGTVPPGDDWCVSTQRLVNQMESAIGAAPDGWLSHSGGSVEVSRMSWYGAGLHASVSAADMVNKKCDIGPWHRSVQGWLGENMSGKSRVLVGRYGCSGTVN